MFFLIQSLWNTTVLFICLYHTTYSDEPVPLLTLIFI